MIRKRLKISKDKMLKGDGYRLVKEHYILANKDTVKKSQSVMAHTEVVPEGPTSSQRPYGTTNKQTNDHCMWCAIVVLAALCIGIIGALSWHITESVRCQDQEIAPKAQESVQALTELDHEAMKYLESKYQQLEDANLETAKLLESQEALIRSLQTDMQRDRREVEVKFSIQGNSIAMNGDKIEKANETITSIRIDTDGFADDLIKLQERSNANVNILQKLREDLDIHTDNITSLQENSKTCSDEMENFQEELKQYGNDLEELKTKHDNLSAEVKPQDCADLITNNISAKCGIFRIYPTLDVQKCSISVYCDMTTQGGGWIVIQRRQDGSVDFYRSWHEYKIGFGNLNSEFWLGLDNIHALVSDGNWELLINMRDDGKGEKYALYKTFSIGPESGGYVLTVGNYSGDAGDSLISMHNGMKFSTKDKDNDIYDIENCAVTYTGAWWHKRCHTSNLNGIYGRTLNRGPRWETLTDMDPVEFVEMKIKQKI